MENLFRLVPGVAHGDIAAANQALWTYVDGEHTLKETNAFLAEVESLTPDLIDSIRQLLPSNTRFGVEEIRRLHRDFEAAKERKSLARSIFDKLFAIFRDPNISGKLSNDMSINLSRYWKWRAEKSVKCLKTWPGDPRLQSFCEHVRHCTVLDQLDSFFIYRFHLKQVCDQSLDLTRLESAILTLKDECRERYRPEQLVEMSFGEFTTDIVLPMMKYFHETDPLDAFSHGKYLVYLRRNILDYMPNIGTDGNIDLLGRAFTRAIELDFARVIQPTFKRLSACPKLLDDCSFLSPSVVNGVVGKQLKDVNLDYWRGMTVKRAISNCPEEWPSFGGRYNPYFLYSFWLSIALLVEHESDGEGEEKKPFTLLNRIINERDGELDKLKRLYHDSFMLTEEKDVLEAVMDILGVFKYIGNALKSKKRNEVNYNNVSFHADSFLGSHRGVAPVLLSRVYQYATRSDILLRFLKPGVECAVTEYRIVSDFANGIVGFCVSNLGEVQLVTRAGDVKMDKTELAIAVSKLAIAAGTDSAQEYSENKAKIEYKRARMFVTRYQQCEILRQEMEILWFHRDCQCEYRFFGLENSKKQIEDIITQIKSEREGIFGVLHSICRGTMTQFPMGHLCLAYNHFQNGNLKEVLEILEASLPVTRRAEFLASVSTVEVERNIAGFEEFMNRIRKTIESWPNSFDIPAHNTDLRVLRNGSDISPDISKAIMNYVLKPIFVDNASQVISTVLYLFFGLLKNTVPQIHQMLVCSPQVTPANLDSFFRFYREASAREEALIHHATVSKIFVLVNPTSLGPETTRVLSKYLSEVKVDNAVGSRIVVVQERNLGSGVPGRFVELMRSFSILNCKANEISIDYEDLANYFYRDPNNVYYFPGYFVYSQKPRTGKSFLILKEISQIEGNFYWRVTVDAYTTLSQLIQELRRGYETFRRHDDHPRILCYHFNVDGYVDNMFALHVLSLIVFRGLSDSTTMPFVITPEMRFYFEFGSCRDCSEDVFIHERFPVGFYMNKLSVPENEPELQREFFSFDDYVVDNCKVVRQENAKYYLGEAAALVKMKHHYSSTRMESNEITVARLGEFTLQLLQNPQEAYDLLSELFSDTPQIFQISDVANVICRFKRPVFSSLFWQQEKEDMYGYVYSPYRYTALTLLLQTAVANSGISYCSCSDSTKEPDEVRMEWVRTQQNAYRYLLIVSMDPDTDSYYVLPNDNSDPLMELNIKRDGCKSMFAQRSKWQERASRPRKMLKLLSILFNFVPGKDDEQRRRNYYASNLILRYDELSEDMRGLLMTHFRSVRIRDIAASENCSPKATPQLFPDLGALASNDARRVSKFIMEAHELLRIVPSLGERCESLAAFLTSVEQYALKNSMMLSYSLTVHGLERIVHLLYRVYSNVPVVLMGETGSGKTYTIRFLQEIIGSNTPLEIKVFDGGTEVDEIQEFVRSRIQANNSNVWFFFDEVNTAPCQWYIKELIVDRYFDGKSLPDTVKFLCAVNPHRTLPEHMKERIKGLELPPGRATELHRLVYRVRTMPESFASYLLPADPPNDLAPTQTLNDLNVQTEYEKSISQVVRLRLLEAPVDKKAGVHFSMKEMFSAPITVEKFGTGLRCEHPWTALNSFVSLISSLAIYAQRLLISKNGGFYQDPSFGSLREPERFAHLIRWFDKFGILPGPGTEPNMPTERRLNLSIQLAFAVTYWLGLSDFSSNSDTPADRDVLLTKVCEFWRSIRSGPNCPEYEKPPTPEQWKENIAQQTKLCADLFVDDDEGLSKNNALCENIWASFVCVTNNIPLWIIGLPGTSKSLAVNIVLSKLFNLRGNCPQLKGLPRIVYQTYMCSEDSRSETLVGQLHNVATKCMMIPDDNKMCVLLLEEIGQADLSPHLPLKCLHSVIDQGYYRPEMPAPVFVTLIGLSNYRVDSAKLNRGILLVRDELSRAAKEQTAINIFESTAQAVRQKYIPEMTDDEFRAFIESHLETVKSVARQFHNASENCQDPCAYIGLRDFYGLIRNLAHIFMRFGRYDWAKLRKALARNLRGAGIDEPQAYRNVSDLIEFSGNYLCQHIQLIRDNLTEKWDNLKAPLMRHMIVVMQDIVPLNILLEQLNLVDPVMIYGINTKGIPDSEWISNDLQSIADAMRHGRTVIFVGVHKCFENLYDVFNLRYETIGGKHFALISYAGDSYPITVHPDFRAIVVLERNEVKDVARPFLNRFEKIRFQNDSLFAATLASVRQNMERLETAAQGAKKLFPCWHSRQADAVADLAEKLRLSQTGQLFVLNAEPAKLVHAIFTSLANNWNENLAQYLLEFLKNGRIHSSISHVIRDYVERDRQFPELYAHWREQDTRHGIQAVILISRIDRRTFDQPEAPGTTTVVVNFSTGSVESEIKKAMRIQHGVVLLYVLVESPRDNFQKRIGQLQSFLVKERAACRADILHCMIVVDVSSCDKNLKFVQTLEWPVICVDTPFESPETCVIKSIDMLATTPLSWFEHDQLSRDWLFSEISKRLGPKATEMLASEQCRTVVNESMQTLMNTDIFKNPVKNSWLMRALCDCQQPPPSLLEYLSAVFMNVMTNFVSIVLEQFSPNQSDSRDDFLCTKAVSVVPQAMHARFTNFENHFSNERKFYKYLFTVASGFNGTAEELEAEINSGEEILLSQEYRDLSPVFWDACVFWCCPSLVVEDEESFNSYLDIVGEIYASVFGTDGDVFQAALNVVDPAWMSFIKCASPLYNFICLSNEGEIEEEEEEEEEAAEEEAAEEEAQKETEEEEEAQEEDALLKLAGAFRSYLSQVVANVMSYKWDNVKQARLFFERDLQYLRTWRSLDEKCDEYLYQTFLLLEVLNMLFEGVEVFNDSADFDVFGRLHPREQEARLTEILNIIDGSHDDAQKRALIGKCLDFSVRESLMLPSSFCD